MQDKKELRISKNALTKEINDNQKSLIMLRNQVNELNEENQRLQKFNTSQKSLSEYIGKVVLWILFAPIMIFRKRK